MEEQHQSGIMILKGSLEIQIRLKSYACIYGNHKRGFSSNTDHRHGQHGRV